MSDELRLTRLEDKLDKVAESVVRMEEQHKATHALLLLHDAKGAKALEKASALEDRMDASAAMWKVPVKWSILLGKVAGAAAAIYGVFKLIGDK